MLLLDPRKKGTPRTLEKGKLFFSQMSPAFGGSLTLSFLLLTCTSSSTKQALRKNYEWTSKQMLLNEKVHTACSSVSQYSSVNKTKSTCTFTCSQIQSEKKTGYGQSEWIYSNRISKFNWLITLCLFSLTTPPSTVSTQN